MIHVITETGKEEMGVLAELVADTAGNKRKRTIVRILFMLVILVCGLAVYGDFRDGAPGSSGVLYLILMVLLLLFIIFCRRYQVMRLKSYYHSEISKKKKELLKREYFFSEDEILIRSGGVESKIQWDAIKRSFTMSHFYILETVQGSYLIINQNEMEEQERLQLDGWMREKVPSNS